MKGCEQFLDEIDIPELDEALLEQIQNFKHSTKLNVDCKKLETDGEIIDIPENTQPREIDFFEDDLDFDDDGYDKEKEYFKTYTRNMVDITNDGGVFKKLIKEGVGPVVPLDALCRIHYSAFLKDSIEPFDSSIMRKRHLMLVIGRHGEGLPGLMIGVSTMRKGEKAQFMLRHDYAYGDMGCPPRIPKKATVLFEVELINFVNNKEMVDYADRMRNVDDDHFKPLSDMLRVANCLHNKGNDHFKHNNIKMALNCYGKALRLVEAADLANEEDEDLLNDFTKKMFLNASLCALNLGYITYAKSMAEKVVEMEPDNVKANFRIGKCYKLMGKYEKSMDHYMKCLSFAPNNHDIIKELADLNNHFEQKKSLEADFYRKMFKINDKDAKKSSISKFLNSDICKRVIYDHFNNQLTVFKKMSASEIFLPNNFTETEILHLHVVADALDLNFEMVPGATKIRIFK